MVTEQPALRRDALRNRERILAAASNLFAERGLGGAGLNEVARVAGVGVGTVYRHFANKQALVDAVFNDRLDEFLNLHDQVEAEPDGWTALRSWMRLQLDVASRDRGMHDLLAPGPDAHEVAGRIAVHLDPIADRIVARAHQEGTLRAEVGRSDLAVIGVMLSLLLRSTAAIKQDHAQRLLDIVLEGLRVHPGQPPLSGQSPSDRVLHAILTSQPSRERGAGPRLPKERNAAPRDTSALTPAAPGRLPPDRSVAQKANTSGGCRQ